jgi:hypothetical protein
MPKKPFMLLGATALGLWVLVMPKMAGAQGNTWAGASLAQMVEAARWRLGILRVNPAFQLTNAGFDSDIYYGYFGEAVHDYTISAGVPVQVLLPLTKKIVLDLFDSPQYVFYLDTRRERAWNNVFRGQVHLALDRFYVQAGGGLADIRQRLSPELNINVRQKENRLDGLALWQVSRETSLALQYGTGKYDYGDASFGETSLSDTLNRKESAIDFLAYFQPTSRVRFFLDGQYGVFTFTEAVSSFKDTRSYGAFGGLEFIPRPARHGGTAGIQGSIRLGYERFDILDTEYTDGSGLVGEVNISAELLRRTTGRAFFSREFNFSVYSNATFYSSTSYGAGISRLLSRTVTISYDISFGRTSYPAAESGGGVSPGPNFRYSTHLFSLNLQLARHLAITLLGSLGRRTGGETGLASNRRFIGFNLIYGVPAAQVSTPISNLAH